MSIFVDEGIYYRKTDESKYKYLLEKWSHLVEIDEIEDYFSNSNDIQVCELLRKYPEFFLKLTNKEFRKKIYVETVINTRPLYFENLDEDEKTEDICMLAIKMNSTNIKYVPKKIKSNEFILSMIEKRWHTIMSIDNPTEEMYLLAISKYPWAIFYVSDKTEKMMIAAKKAHGLYKNTNMPQYYNAVLEYVKENGYSIQYVKKEFRTYELCKAALQKSPGAIKYIRKSLLEEYPDLKNYVIK